MTQSSASGWLRNKREVAQTGTDVAQNTILVHRGARSPKHMAWCPDPLSVDLPQLVF